MHPKLKDMRKLGIREIFAGKYRLRGENLLGGKEEKGSWPLWS